MVHLSERSARGRVGLGWMVSVVAAILVLWGCGESGSPGPAPAPVACAAGEVATPEGTCQPEEPQGCPPGEWASEDGTCQAAGIPPEACAEGFEPDGNGGCNAILPAEACPFGQMAVPGETSCREVAPCGDGPWATIPVEANTQFVDQAYAGGDSDGTMARPWTTVQQGVDAAAGGAIVAVADGVYEEDVRIEGKAVRLWGRCPGRVEVRGTGVEVGAIEVFWGDADGAEIRGLAVTGVNAGIAVVGASDVRIEHVWVHEAGSRGIDIEDAYGPTSVTVRGSLVEQNHQNGVYVSGSDAEFEATVVRDTQPMNGQSGRGLSIRADEATGERANVVIRGCVVEQNHNAGVRVHGSDVTVEATVVRGTQPVNGQFGWGIEIANNPDTGERANVDIRGCVVEQNHDAGVFIEGSDAKIKTTVVRATEAVNGQSGWGIAIQTAPYMGVRATVGIRSCVVEQNHDVSIFVAGSDAELEATVVRATQAVNAHGGWGILIQAEDPPMGERAKVGIRGCVVEQNHQVGIAVSASEAMLEASAILDTAADADGNFGDGIFVQQGAATIQSTVISGNARAGVSNFGSDITVLSSIITCNAFDINGETNGGIPFSFDDSADWQCSRAGAEDCTETDTCHVISAGLAPPPPI